MRDSKTNSTTICGSYTGKNRNYYNEVVECGGNNNLLILHTGERAAILILKLHFHEFDEKEFCYAPSSCGL